MRFIMEENKMLIDYKIYGDWIFDWQFSAPSFEDGNKLIYGDDDKEKGDK